MARTEFLLESPLESRVDSDDLEHCSIATGVWTWYTQVIINRKRQPPLGEDRTFGAKAIAVIGLFRRKTSLVAESAMVRGRKWYSRRGIQFPYPCLAAFEGVTDRQPRCIYGSCSWLLHWNLRLDIRADFLSLPIVHQDKTFGSIIARLPYHFRDCYDLFVAHSLDNLDSVTGAHPSHSQSAHL